MRAGDMRDRVVLQRATEAQDAFGEPIATWTNLATVWSQVEWMGGAEVDPGQQLVGSVPAIVRVRRSSDTAGLREDDRVLVPNRATSVLSNAITAAGTSIVVDQSGVLPPAGGPDYVVRVGSELMTVTAGAGSTASPLTVTRGAHGTTAAKHQSGATLHVLDEFNVRSVMPVGRDMELVAERVR